MFAQLMVEKYVVMKSPILVATASRWRALFASTVMLLLLGGCAATRDHKEGLHLIEEGKVEEAIAKLESAHALAPDDIAIKTDLAKIRERVTNRLLVEANADRVGERLDRAQAGFERVLKITPGNSRAIYGLNLVDMNRRHIVAADKAKEQLESGELDAAKATLATILAQNPNNTRAIQLYRQVTERQSSQNAAGPQLGPKFKKPVMLQFRDANLKMVFESLSKASGINLLLDKDVRSDLKTSIFAKDVSVEDTIDLILMQNQLEKKILSDNTLLIYPNTPAKNKEYQDLKIKSFHLVNADAKQMQTMLKTLLKTKDIFVHEKTNSILIRDTPDGIRLAEKMINDQDIADPEVMLEIEVLEISHAKASNLGIQLPSQLTLSPKVGTGGAASISELKGINQSNLIVSPVPTLTFNFSLTDSDTRVLASPRIRARNKEKAKILIGDRVPVITNSVTPVSTGSPVVTGSIQYLDVGLKVEVEPEIHLDGEVGIKVNLEVSSIVKEVSNPISGSLAYQIGTRTAATVLRLKDGETQVLAGLIDNEDRKSGIRVPGLGEVPILGRLFSNQSENTQKTEIVLSITPRIVSSAKLQEAGSMEYWTGTEATLRENPLVLRQTGTVALPTPGGATAPGTAQPGAAATPGRPGPRGPARTLPRAVTDAAAATQPPVEAPAVPALPAVIGVQGPAQAKVGDKISIQVTAQLPSPANSIGVLLSYDPTALRVLDVAEGDLFKQRNLESNFSRDVDPSGGQVSVELAQKSGDASPGAGAIASVSFEVIAAKPQSFVTVTRVTPTGPEGGALPFSTPAPHALTLLP